MIKDQQKLKNKLKGKSHEYLKGFEDGYVCRLNDEDHYDNEQNIQIGFAS